MSGLTDTIKGKGGDYLGTAERRLAIMRYLCRCRHTTTSALAETFSVSERTIRRDIEALSEREPIYTQPGRYGGGIYIVDNYYMNYIYFSVEETNVLNKLFAFAEVHNDILTDYEKDILRKLIDNHSKPLSPKSY